MISRETCQESGRFHLAQVPGAAERRGRGAAYVGRGAPWPKACFHARIRAPKYVPPLFFHFSYLFLPSCSADYALSIGLIPFAFPAKCRFQAASSVHCRRLLSPSRVFFLEQYFGSHGA